jgi:hypothetical protein
MPKLALPIVYASLLALGAWAVVSPGPALGTGLSVLMVAGGLALLIIGADYMVHGAVRLARRLGVSPVFYRGDGRRRSGPAPRNWRRRSGRH